jgi:hypothetical protein
MCRLPIELMALIIKFSRKPLPFVPDEEAPIASKWKDVCQPELATFMRVSKVSLSYWSQLGQVSADSSDDLFHYSTFTLQGSGYWQFGKLFLWL